MLKAMRDKELVDKLKADQDRIERENMKRNNLLKLKKQMLDNE